MRTAPDFLPLNALILPPPWPAVVAFVEVLGAVSLGMMLARFVRRRETPNALDIVAAVIVVAAFLAALVHGLALAGVASLAVLRSLGLAIGISSLGLLRAHRAVATFGDQVRSVFRRAGPVQRWMILASSTTVVGLVLASFGPPTDADSLGYHLFVPLDWIGHQGAQAAPDFLHARLIGLGESLNMLGLAIGSDCLGSVFQAIGLLAAVVALVSVATTEADGVFGFAIVASCLLNPLLTLTSKPQLLPAAATCVALALFVAHRRTAFQKLDAGVLWLIFGCLNFAAACKYSCIPPAVAVAILVLASLWQTRWRSTALLVALSTFAVIAFPVFFRNFLFYRDPLSPMLESLKERADPVITTFAGYLRDFGGDRSLHHLVRLPWNYLVPTKPWQLTSVLGAGALAVVVAVGRRTENVDVLAAAIGVTLVTVVFGQLQARFFFEPYLWAGLLAVLASWGLRKRFVFALLSVQLVLTSAVALFAAWNFFPAALTQSAREDLMTRMTIDYALAKWLDGVLPADAVVATDRLSMSLVPRPVVPVDFAKMAIQSTIDAPQQRARIRSVLSKARANVLLVTLPVESSPYDWMVPGLDKPRVISPPFADATRNPWKAGLPYRVALYDLR